VQRHSFGVRTSARLRALCLAALPADMRGALITLVSRRVAAFEARPPSRFGAVAWCPTSHRSCASSSQGPQTGPDASRGYDVSEYAGLWRTLSELEPRWPSSQSVAVVGPIGDGFAASALACAHDVVGREATTVVSTQPRSRWQSVRLQVVCTSPDDVCELHSRLRALEGVRAVV
jgi:putative lipoic acid-binding regulatory protein